MKQPVNYLMILYILRNLPLELEWQGAPQLAVGYLARASQTEPFRDCRNVATLSLYFPLDSATHSKLWGTRPKRLIYKIAHFLYSTALPMIVSKM